MVCPILRKVIQKGSLVGDTKKKIYEYLVEGATAGLTDGALYDSVKKKVPKANSKRIVRAGFLALSDPRLTDRTILNVIYALAIKHRLDPEVEGDDDDDDGDGETLTETTTKPATAERKKKK
jgi:hypothetical protein